jgi:hypothetical protein
MCIHSHTNARHTSLLHVCKVRFLSGMCVAATRPCERKYHAAQIRSCPGISYGHASVCAKSGHEPWMHGCVCVVFLRLDSRCEPMSTAARARTHTHTRMYARTTGVVFAFAPAQGELLGVPVTAPVPRRQFSAERAKPRAPVNGKKRACSSARD